MIKYSEFDLAIQKAVAKFKSWDKSQSIRLISHLDADGISASAILTNLLNLENRKYTISILQQLTKDDILKMSKETDKYFIFSDLGSGQLKDINTFLKDKDIIILDHHEIPETEIPENVTHINPHSFEIDGSKEISGAGVAYLFTEKVNPESEKLAHIAIIGAIGDVQEENGFLHLNNQILQKALKQETIRTKKGLRVFGRQTRPIHKVLEYSSDPHIPGVSGSESGAIQFLHHLGINPKKSNDWKKMIDLNEDEMKKLVTGIIMKRLGEVNPEDVIGEIYTLPNEKRQSPTRDAREFATLLNACGRMNRASCGIGTCLGIEKDIKMALQTSADYKKEIVFAINWYEENKDNPEKIIKGNNYIIINAKNEIRNTIIGTLASIISKGNDIQENTYIMSLARMEKSTKVSLRSTKTDNENLDLREIVKKITEIVGGEAGGHMQAAGALIPIEKEAEFIQEAQKVLEQ